MRNLETLEDCYLNRQVFFKKDISYGGSFGTVLAGTAGKIVDFGAGCGDPVIELIPTKQKVICPFEFLQM